MNQVTTVHWNIYEFPPPKKMYGVNAAGPVHNYNPNGVSQATGLVSVKPNAAHDYHSKKKKKTQWSITALSWNTHPHPKILFLA